MKKSYLRPYFRAGMTAFVVIFISTVFFFMMAHMQNVTEKLLLIKHILRPIWLGLIFAFLLLPVHNRILRCLWSISARANGQIDARS